MSFCHLCGSSGAIKCARCANYVCVRHSVQIVGHDGEPETVCGRCARLAAEEHDAR